MSSRTKPRRYRPKYRRKYRGNRPYRTDPGRSYTNRENANLTFVDPHKYVTFRYVELFSNSITTATGAQQTMNANSLFDPNRTGSGHQPMGFDQLAAIWNRYRILRAKCTVKFISSASYFATVIPLNGLLVSAIADQATFQTAAEQRMAKTVAVGAGGPSPTVRFNASLDKVNGCLRVEYLADDRFEASVGSSPTEVITLTIGLFNPTGATIVPYYSVQIDYLSDMHDPISLAPSLSRVTYGQGMNRDELIKLQIQLTYEYEAAENPVKKTELGKRLHNIQKKLNKLSGQRADPSALAAKQLL